MMGMVLANVLKRGLQIVGVRLLQEQRVLLLHSKLSCVDAAPTV